MKSDFGRFLSEGKAIFLLIIVLILNTVLAVLIFNSLYLQSPSERVLYSSSRDVMIENLLEYSQRLAQDLGVQNRSSVREALASFNYEMALAEDGDELARIIFNQGRQVQETIVREWDALLRENILTLVNQDENLKEETGKIEFTLNISLSQGVTADPDVLHEDTKEAIRELFQSGGMVQDQIFQLEFEEGRSRLLVPYNPLDYIQSLSEEIDSLRVSIHELRVASGYAEMSGAGVVIKLFDAPHGYTASNIIHDSDVRDVVNELFAAGAKGVSVGGQRIISTTPIRCVGPVIRVNQKEIPANPVIIEAIGDPEVLSSGLDIIRFSLELHRNFRMEVEKQEQMVLPPYRN